MQGKFKIIITTICFLLFINFNAFNAFAETRLVNITGDTISVNTETGFNVLRLEIDDSNAYIDRDATGSLIFVDTVTTSKTLGDLAALNSASNAGIVSSGSGQINKVWKTDASGNPDWRTDATGAGGESFPVGSVYINITGTNPATELGYGTWSQIAQGQFLVGQNTGDTDFDVAEETGGAKTVTLTQNELPSHAHKQIGMTGSTGNFTGAINDVSSGGAGGSPTTANMSIDTVATGSGVAFSKIPPYYVVYIWKRTV